jgi:hypothetical protein
MHKRTTLGVRIPDATIVAASKRFGRYKREAAKAVRSADAEDRTEKLEKLSDMLHSLIRQGAARDPNWRKKIERLSAILRNLECSAHDIEGFSILLEGLQFEWNVGKYSKYHEEFMRETGILFSALVEAGEERDYVIHTRQLESPLDFIGWKNRKNVIIDGEVGTDAGNSMRGGSLLIKGYADQDLGIYMEGGKITLEGRGYGTVGLNMRGGIIEVHGGYAPFPFDTRIPRIGHGMTGGEIHMHGILRDCYKKPPMDDIELLRSAGKHVKHGRIFYEGELIVDK